MENKGEDDIPAGRNDQEDDDEHDEDWSNNNNTNNTNNTNSNTNNLTIWQTLQANRSSTTVVKKRDKCKAVFMGQLLAVVAASMSASAYTLARTFQLQTQWFQLFWMYVLLTCTYLWKKRPSNDNSQQQQQDTTPSPYLLPGTNIRLRIPWYIYFGYSLLDTLPNSMVLAAFQYTSLTSATLLMSLTVPSTMIFTRHVLNKSFTPTQYVGVVVCVLGGMATIWSDQDTNNNSTTENDNPNADDATIQSHSFLVGDLLAIAAALCYGLGDTLAEYSVKHLDRTEYLGMLGLFGLLTSGLLVLIVEGTTLVQYYQETSVSTKLAVAAILTWYVASVYAYYTYEALFLVASDATLLNLSLQAANLYTILFSFVFFHVVPSMQFFVAAALVVAGVVLYEVVSQNDEQQDGTGNTAIEYERAATSDADGGEVEVEELPLPDGGSPGRDQYGAFALSNSHK